MTILKEKRVIMNEIDKDMATMKPVWEKERNTQITIRWPMTTTTATTTIIGGSIHMKEVQ